MSDAEKYNKMLYDEVKDFYGKEVDVRITIEDVGLTFYGKMILGLDSRLKPPHRLNVHDSKGNTLLLQLDKNKMNIIFSELS